MKRNFFTAVILLFNLPFVVHAGSNSRSFYFDSIHSVIAQAASTNSAEAPSLTKIGTYECGKQPKQVLFSPDSSFIALPLLNDNGFDLFSLEDKKITKRISPPSSEQLGFAEGLFISSKNTFLVSQMTTGNLYEFSFPSFELLRTIPTEGEWSKFIIYNEKENLLCVSNWISNNVSVIDYESGEVINKIKTAASPRGLLFTDDGKSIVVLCFDGGKIQKFNIEDGEKLAETSIEKSAMRHIVAPSSGKKAYVSDMYYARIYEIDLDTLEILRKVKVHNNPNTIALAEDRWLFVSCRGKNNPTDYTLRSPENGKIYIIDIESMTVVDSFEGGNQPTGLDISSDGSFLCFSNFQDGNIELYSFSSSEEAETNK